MAPCRWVLSGISSATMKPIRLLPSASRVTADELSRSIESDICACDFYVEGAEAGVEVPGGYQLGGILSIDHHAPGSRMARVVSSANLAIAHVRQSGLPAGQIVINHTDCDSILSSGVAAGRLEPADHFGEAAIFTPYVCRLSIPVTAAGGTPAPTRALGALC